MKNKTSTTDKKNNRQRNLQIFLLQFYIQDKSELIILLYLDFGLGDYSEENN